MHSTYSIKYIELDSEVQGCIQNCSCSKTFMWNWRNVLVSWQPNFHTSFILQLLCCPGYHMSVTTTAVLYNNYAP